MSKKLQNMRRVLPALLWLMLLALSPAQLLARDFEYTYEGQTLIYTVLDEEAKTVETKEGYSYNPGNKVEGVLVLPETVNDGNSDYTLVEIGEFAFINCTGLTSVTIPNSVTTIGDSAFGNCGLTSMTIPNSVTIIERDAFRLCRSLTYVIIGNSIKTIEDNAFQECSSLTDVIFWNSSTVSSNDRPLCSSDVFRGCSSLKKIALPEHLYGFGIYSLFESWVYYPDGINVVYEDGILRNEDYSTIYYASSAISGEFTIPNSVTTIGNYAFWGCPNLTEVTFPNSVTTIGEGSFQDCSGLVSIISEAVEPPAMYDRSTFNGIYENCTLIIPDEAVEKYLTNYDWVLFKDIKCASGNLNIVDNDDFRYYVNTDNNSAMLLGPTKSMTEVVIPGKANFGDAMYDVTSIAANAFYDKGLTSVIIGSGIKYIGDHAFFSNNMESIELPSSVTTIGRYAFIYNRSLAAIALNDGLTTIGEEAFAYNGLTSVIIPNSVTTISTRAFFFCRDLTSVTIPNSVTKIDQGAFAYSGLTSVIIPNSVTTIGQGAFEASRLTSVTIPNSVTTIGAGAFDYCPSITSLTFGSGLTEIPKEAFLGCSLTEVVIPSGVTKIASSAFSNNKLTNLVIGCDITEIEAGAFTGNDQLTSINITAPKPPIADGNEFSAQNAQLNVLKDSREAYGSAACWSQFEGADLVPISTIEILKEDAPAAYAADGSGLQIQYTVKVAPENASFKDCIFWASSSPEVATVDNNGLVTLVEGAEGEAKITARTLYAGVLSSVTVNDDIPTGIDDVCGDLGGIDAKRPNDIYTLQGVCVKRNATEDDVKALTPGIYIIAGKKVMVK